MSLAIVTGANRSPGIGYEIVRGLARALPTGSKVILTSRIKSMGEVAVQELNQISDLENGVIYHQLDIGDEESIISLRKFVETSMQKWGFKGLDILVNNAGCAFTMQDPTPFAEQAQQSININYHGTKHMIETFLPLCNKNASLIGISSTSGQLGSSWSGELKRTLLKADLTMAELDKIAEEFVALAKSGEHKEKGFPGSAYGTSKTLMTQLHRIVARDANLTDGNSKPVFAAAICPGLCRTYMATGRGTFMANVLWFASWFIGHSAAGGADTPLWLTCPSLGLAQEEKMQKYNGKFIRGRAIQDY